MNKSAAASPSPVASTALLPALATNNSQGCWLYASRPTIIVLIKFDTNMRADIESAPTSSAAASHRPTMAICNHSVGEDIILPLETLRKKEVKYGTI